MCFHFLHHDNLWRLEYFSVFLRKSGPLVMFTSFLPVRYYTIFGNNYKLDCFLWFFCHLHSLQHSIILDHSLLCIIFLLFILHVPYCIRLIILDLIMCIMLFVTYALCVTWLFLMLFFYLSYF